MNRNSPAFLLPPVNFSAWEELQCYPWKKYRLCSTREITLSDGLRWKRGTNSGFTVNLQSNVGISQNLTPGAVAKPFIWFKLCLFFLLKIFNAEFDIFVYWAVNTCTLQCHQCFQFVLQPICVQRINTKHCHTYPVDAEIHLGKHLVCSGCLRNQLRKAFFLHQYWGG